MKKLAIEDIQFIDTYLSNSDITYEDIRVEMIDHVASEIEARMDSGDSRDFYDIFKDFMIDNKASIESEGSKIFNSKILIEVFKKFSKNLISWQVLLGSIASFGLFRYIDLFVYKIDDAALIVFPMMLLTIICFIPFIINGKKKYSFVGSFGLILYFFFTINNQFIPHLEYHSFAFYINIAVTSVFFTCSIKTMLELSLYYKKHFSIASSNLSVND